MIGEGLQVTFLGHNSWHVGTRNSYVLIDPILKEGFGHSPEMVFKIWPPRAVDVPHMPNVSAVILSHEHLDHFHLPSLATLPAGTPVITGILTPSAVTEAIQDLGLDVIRAVPGDTYQVGDLEVQLFPAGAGTIFWEQRVNQILVRRAGVLGEDILFTVDALLSEMFLDAVEQGSLRLPRMAVVLNNSQVVPVGGLGPYSNLLEANTTSRTDMTGLEVLKELLVDYMKPLRGVPEVALGGNGYISPRSTYGPFLYSDHRWMAEIANELQSYHKVYGPRPGQCMNLLPGKEVFFEAVSWVLPEVEFEQAALHRQHEFLRNPVPEQIAPVFKPFASDSEAADAQQLVEAELPFLARGLAGTEVGEMAARVHEHLNGVLGSRRMLLCLLAGPGGRTLQYAWDIADINFFPENLPEQEWTITYPFGLKCYLQDFAAVLRGDLQIWDLAGIAMQPWYVGDSYATMVTAFYKLYAEQMRPDLAAKVYHRSLDLLRGSGRLPKAAVHSTQTD